MRDSGKLLQLIHRGMVNAGLDVDTIYQRLGYDARTLPLGDQRPRHDLQAYFWRTVETVTRDREIGLTLCPYLPVFHGGSLEYLFLSSPNFGEGLRLALGYRRLISDQFQARLRRDDDGPRIVRHQP